MFFLNKISVNINNVSILKEINLKILPGEIHAIMGPNGSGKSTLSLTISGHNDYKIICGNIFFKNKNITNLSVYDRALMGIFTSFQNPIEIPGISNFDFLKNSINSLRKSKNLSKLNIIEFNKLINKYIDELKIDKSFLNRFVNVLHSGGEKKKNEILQMLVIKPDLIILDEIDSGLDIDSLKIISKIVKKFFNKNKYLIIITHRSNILKYLKPNFVHILINGKLIKSGNFDLSNKIENLGYEWIINE